MYSIYTLSDPRNEAIRYVGISINVEARFKSHLAPHGNLDKSIWIQGLKADGLLPTLSIIETTETLNEAKERESYWIDHYLELEAPLLNSIIPSRKGVKTLEVNYFLRPQTTYPGAYHRKYKDHR